MSNILARSTSPSTSIDAVGIVKQMSSVTSTKQTDDATRSSVELARRLRRMKRKLLLLHVDEHRQMMLLRTMSESSALGGSQISFDTSSHLVCPLDEDLTEAED
jgi:Mrp family chromosome partitioning ATPase